MGRIWPALDINDVDRSDLVLALLDDFSPTGIEERTSSVRAFFSSSEARDAARAVLAGQYPVASIDLPDEDWGRRSQENLAPVTIGRVTILPRGGSPPTGQNAPSTRTPAISIVIQPSTGFGTGHHASTRLCLRALQALDLTNAAVLDAGTGSGILAIAAARLGAKRAIGFDNDADAIQAARENLLLNPEADNVVFDLADLTAVPLPGADVVTANLTGALLTRAGHLLARAVRPGGTLILGGLLGHERAGVLDALNAGRAIEHLSEASEEEWVCLVVRAR